MNRSLVVMAGALLLSLPGCPNTEEEKRECDLPAFDLSACDRSGFAAVQADGVWKTNVTLDGVGTPTAFLLTPEQSQSLLFATPLTERNVAGDTFYLATDYVRSFSTLRIAIAGCEAPEPNRVTGQFRRCVDGERDLEGTFEAVRVQRPAGEQEASGVGLVSEAALPRGMAMDVFVSGGYAYVTALSAGLFIYDVKDPAAPRKVAELTPTADNWYRSWVKGTTLYITSQSEGLLVYDVANPEDPKRLMALPGGSSLLEAWGLFVDGDRLYLMSPSPRAEVLIFDVSKPAAPALLTRYFIPESDALKGQFPVDGVVFNNQLYLGHWAYGLAVVRVTQGASPKFLGRFGYDNATSRTVAVGTIGDQTVAFEASEGWGSRLRSLEVTVETVDMSDVAHIKELGRFEMGPASPVLGLTLVGTKLYVAHSQDGLRVLDVSNPSTPRQIAYYNTWRETDSGRGRAFLDGLTGVKVPGDGYVYATETSRGLLVFREQ